jgi:hypothetical protein
MTEMAPVSMSEERFVRVLGQRIRVSIRPGAGVPLVLCNGTAPA